MKNKTTVKNTTGPQWGKAALLRLTTIPIAFLILVGGIVQLVRFADVGFPPLFPVIAAGYIIFWVIPLSFAIYYIWRKAGHIDHTWENRVATLPIRPPNAWALGGRSV